MREYFVGARLAAQTYWPPEEGHILTNSARAQAMQVMPTETKTQPHTRPTGPPPAIPWAMDAVQPSHYMTERQ